MKTKMKLWDGRVVTIEQTTTAILASYDGEAEAKHITSEQYMKLVLQGVPCGNIV